jgi:pimeloyl-ACP methyl ester carboxylesterase
VHVTVSFGPALKRLTRVGPAEIASVTSGPPDAPPVLFLHGFPTHGWLWRKVLVELGDDVHALVPDLPGLGDTVVSPYADFTMPAQAELLLEWLDRMGVGPVAVVAHDQGGAVAQQLVANHPDRVSHLGLIDTVAYDNWPVRLVTVLSKLARTPGLDSVAYSLGLPRPVGRLVFRRAVRDPRVMADDVVEEYLRPLLTADGRERARRFVLAGDARHTLECLPGLRAWDGPAFVAWGADDAFLSPSWGLRLVDDLRGADRLHLLPFCGHLAPEERPAELAALVRELLAR